MDTVKRGAPGIEAADLRALRNADRISLSFTDGAYAIRAVRDREKTANGFEQAVVISCDGKVVDYSKATLFGSTDNDYRYCSEAILTPSEDEVWQTAVGFIKPGDVLSLNWTASCNGWTEDHGLHIDHLRLRIKRQNGDKIKRYAFLLRTQVCPDNTARMIRRHAW